MQNAQQQMDALQAALNDSSAKADAAALQQAELTAQIEQLTAELSRIAQGSDSFLTQQNQLAQALSAKRLEQVTRRKDAELAYSQIAALEQRAKDAAARRTALEESLAALAARSEACRTEITAIRKAKTDSQTAITQKEQAIREATEKRLACQQKETEALAKARTASDSREEMGREMARLAERKAAAESEYDQTVAKLWDEYQLSVSQAEELCVEFDSLTALRAQVADLRGKIRALGSVNVSAIEEYKEVKARYDELSRQVTDVEESRNELGRMIAKLSAQMREIFTDSFRAINENFSRVFTELFGGGEASLVLEDESDVLACGIGIRVAPPGKVIKNLEALSGGEQALVAISIYFAILAVNPAPFCILDEIEAALDDANVVRFAQYLRRISDKTQFIVITHRRGTMAVSYTHLDEYQLSVSQAEELCVEFDSLTALRAQVADLRGKIRALGSVNVSAIEEYKEVKARYDELSRQVTDVEESRNELGRMIAKLSAQMREIFTDSFRAINENFSRVFTELFGGGEASLVLEDESDVLACGIGIRVAPPGKVIKNLEALSGGEQALVAISIYFAILAVNPAPFCILDEIEAALDDANVVRFAQYLRRISDKTQFIVITHRRGTMEAANVLYGVTMQEDGVSKLLKLDLEQVDATLVS